MGMHEAFDSRCHKRKRRGSSKWKSLFAGKPINIASVTLRRGWFHCSGLVWKLHFLRKDWNSFLGKNSISCLDRPRTCPEESLVCPWARKAGRTQTGPASGCTGGEDWKKILPLRPLSPVPPQDHAVGISGCEKQPWAWLANQARLQQLGSSVFDILEKTGWTRAALWVWESHSRGLQVFYSLLSPVWNVTNRWRLALGMDILQHLPLDQESGWLVLWHALCRWIRLLNSNFSTLRHYRCSSRF